MHSSCSVGASRRSRRRSPAPFFGKLWVLSREEKLRHGAAKEGRFDRGTARSGDVITCRTSSSAGGPPQLSGRSCALPCSPWSAHESTSRLIAAALGCTQRSTALCSSRRLLPSPASSPSLPAP